MLFIAAFIGQAVAEEGDVMSEALHQLTAGSTVIMPNTFPQSGAVTQFTAYFTTLVPVFLQIWRQNITTNTTFSVVYSQKVYPRSTAGPQTVLVFQYD